ncbi:galactose mutarotase-like protein [Exidia glandulosa HHB12029]|uniref:Galactose mutarotase-like protein n=1 Tax=Exidia glandulosa HHB12029 TaxID=1314781 RepID=A0A165Q2T7_EXIGL|nr:galactose mutarotase-like protein [Exidia glandulosa HHB12029]
MMSSAALVALALVMSVRAASSDVAAVLSRRVANLKSGWDAASLTADVQNLLSTVKADFTWPNVNYLSGCDAQRSNWPAQSHWNHIYDLAAAYVGSAPTQYEGDEGVLNVTLSAMDWWFSRDFTNGDCLVNGGTASCPCGTPGLWNTNWYSNVILIPSIVGNACLLLQSTDPPALTDVARDSCTRITQRGFSTFGTGAGFLAGANILQIASIGISAGLISGNESTIAAGYGHINDEVVVHPEIKVDGIKQDGGFQQHLGVLYNGNYGKAFIESILSLATESAGTIWESGQVNKDAFAGLIDGSAWMVYQNVKTNILHWDFSSLARFISFRTNDLGGLAQTAGILLNVDSIRDLGNLWNEQTLVRVADLLETPTGNANVGKLFGNRMFWANDYMVHRGKNYVTTVKMFSSRISNTECVNAANPLGFHLSDGTVYTYLEGSEYENIAASWDWNLIPGTTTDYANTPLACGTAQQTGVESFVGGVSDRTLGIAAMKFTNPLTRALGWQKAWFFLPGDVMHVMVNGIASQSSADVYSVLEQRRLVGDVVVDGQTLGASANLTRARTLWHGNTGYILDNTPLSVSFGPRTGAWSAIGTSTQPPETVDLFAAWYHHTNLSTPASYTVLPGRSSQAFIQQSRSLRIETLANDVHKMGVWDARNGVLMAVFWASAVDMHLPGIFLSMDVSTPVTLIGKFSGNPRSWKVTVADPSQSATEVRVRFNWLSAAKALPEGWGGIELGELRIALPQGADAGKSVTVSVL